MHIFLRLNSLGTDGAQGDGCALGELEGMGKADDVRFFRTCARYLLHSLPASSLKGPIWSPVMSGTEHEV